ncbi:MAG TPA: hypothetical protein VGH33_03035 [Isosphaeraceae bacterium]
MHHRHLLIAYLLLVIPLAARAEGTYKAEVLKEAPPAALAPAIKGELNPTAYRITDSSGKPYADVWLRKATPASGKPNGPSGTIQFPSLAEGTLIGAIRYGSDGQDFRDQAIPPGVYTVRFGLQPQNGAHLGKSPFRDYFLLLPAAKDTSPEVLAKKPLDERSAEAAGTTHPACLELLAAAEPAKADDPKMVNDAEKNTWALVIPVPLAVMGDPAPANLDMQVIVSGASMEP